MNDYLYPQNYPIILEASVSEKSTSFSFTAPCGKLGVYEQIAFYRLTPERLLQILREHDGYTEQELTDA